MTRGRILLISALAAGAVVAIVGGLYCAGWLRAIPHQARFKTIECEQLRYDVTSWVGTSGTILVEVSPLLTLGDGSFGYRITYTLEEAKSVAAIYIFQGQVSVVVDAQTLAPLEYEERMTTGLAMSGAQKKHTKLVFNRAQGLLECYKEGEQMPGVLRSKNSHPTAPNSQHFASLIYYLRDVPMKVGQEVSVPMADRKDDYVIKATVLREEDYEALDGTTRKALVVNTVADFGKEEIKGANFMVWLDKAERHMVRLDAKTAWGTISAKLTKRAIVTPTSPRNDESSGNHTSPVPVDPASR